jgi:NDP-sugar pyrophosphorylase family protein
MQAIFLAAGEGTRMRPLTYHVPKPMARVGGKNLLEHNIVHLPSEIDELIIVVGYLAEQIENHFGNEYAGRSVTYVKQRKLRGTAHALSLCKKHIRGRFLVLMGDDIYGTEDVAECLKHEWAWLVKKVHGKFTGGRIIYDQQGNVTSVKEGTHNVKTAFVGTNLFVLQPEYFNYQMVPVKGGEEFGLPQTVALNANDFPIKMIEAKNWQQITDMDDLKRLRTSLSKRQKSP